MAFDHGTRPFFAPCLHSLVLLYGVWSCRSRLTNRQWFSGFCVIKRVFFFGIVFDDRLSWNEQIKQLISKAGKRVGMLGRLRRSLTRENADIIYCSLIRPVLEYCVSVWGCFGERHKHGLEVIQNRAVRKVARTVRSDPEMDVLKWPTPEERCRKSVFKFVKKCL